MTKKVTPRLVMAILSAGMLSFLGILDETATTVTFPPSCAEDLISKFHDDAAYPKNLISNYFQ